MPSRLNPYLSFAGNAREAMEFYRSVFGGHLSVSTFGEFGASDDPAVADGVMHAMLETKLGFTLMASDTPPGMEASAPGGSITLSLSGDDAELLRGYFDALAEGGTVGVPLEKQMWGDEFGQLVDKFGTPWMVDITAL